MPGPAPDNLIGDSLLHFEKLHKTNLTQRRDRMSLAQVGYSQLAFGHAFVVF